MADTPPIPAGEMTYEQADTRQRAIFNALWDKRWGMGLSGLWYPPFPNHHRSGVYWWKAALEANVGFKEEELEPLIQGLQKRDKR
jgi:hypothetical protein